MQEIARSHSFERRNHVKFSCRLGAGVQLAAQAAVTATVRTGPAAIVGGWGGAGGGLNSTEGIDMF